MISTQKKARTAISAAMMPFDWTKITKFKVAVAMNRVRFMCKSGYTGSLSALRGMKPSIAVVLRVAATNRLKLLSDFKVKNIDTGSAIKQQ